MAKYRLVKPSVWDKPWFRKLESDAKLLFLYLITNSLTTICGAYEVTIERICFDTGLDADVARPILERFDKLNKIKFDEEAGWILIMNFTEHQKPNFSIVQGMERAIADCPQWIKDTISPMIDDLTEQFNANKSKGKGDEKPPKPTTRKPTAKPVKPEDDAPPQKKATRIPEPFNLTKEMREWAGERCPAVDLQHETEKFVNYWRAKSGKDATKLDWVSTWRNWILKASEERQYGTNNRNNKQGKAGSAGTHDEQVFGESADFYAQFPTETTQ